MGGIDDATRELPVARGQRVQAFIALVASALLWAIPPIAYLAGYQIGKRRPMGYGLRDPRRAVGGDGADTRAPRR